MLDKHSPPVRKLLDDIDAEITRLHTSMERVGRTENETNIARGQIKALRWIVKQIEGEPQETEIDG